MTLGSFDREVEALRGRIEALLACADLSGAEEETLRTALEELSVSVEELEVASEELQQQNAEFLAVHQELQTQRARYEALFDLAPDGYLVTDLYGLIEEANLAASRLLGLRRDNLLGKPLLSYVSRDDCDPFMRQLAFCRDGGELGNEPWVLHLQSRDGEPFAASITVAPVRGAGRQLIGLRWMIRDVTERARREEQIAFQARALDHVGDAVIAVDEEERVTYLNRRAARQYGVDAADAVGRKLSNLYDTEWLDPADEAAAYLALVAEGRWRGQNIHVKRNGERIVVESLVTVLEDGDGRRTGMLAAIRDVTEQVQIEDEREWLLEENRAQRQFLERLIEAAPVGIAVVRAPDFRYEQVNSRYRAIQGGRKRRMVGRTVADVFPEGAAAGAISFLEQACRTGRTVSIREYQAAVGPGREGTYWNLDHVPLHDTSGEVDRVLIVAQEVTEQVERRREIEAMAEAIGRERNVLDTVLENTFAELAYLDPDFNFVMVNSAYAEGSGHSREELIGRYHFDLFPNGENCAIFEQVRDTGQAISFHAKPFEYADQPERGTTYWDWTLVPVKDDKGGVQGLVFSLTDVTEQERARLAVQQYADRLRVLHDADRAVLDVRSPGEIAAAVLPHLRATVDCESVVVALFDRATGAVSPLAADPQDRHPLPVEQHAALDYNTVLEALEQGQIHRVPGLDEPGEASPLAAALHARGASAHVHVPLIAQGELIGALNLGLAEPRELSEDEMLVVNEVADQLAIAIQQARLNEQVEQYAHELEDMVAERTEALRASEARLRAIYENAGIGIILSDLEGCILECNLAFERMVGYSSKALRGRHLRQLVHPEDAEASLALAREVVSGQREGYQLVKRYLRSDGSVFWGRLTATGIAGQAGELRYMVGLIEDITERRQAQEALIRSEKLNATGRLAASLAHEISNPLQSVIGCLGLAQEMLDEEAPVGRYIDIGLEELERASRIVGRLRDVARQSDDATREPVQVGELLEKTALLTRKHCQAHGVTLDLALPEDLPDVEVVSDHIQQVFLNLILNALEATPEGGSIQVRVESTDDPPGVAVRVIDTGDGIDPEVLPRLFEPFFTTKSSGTGLGLYVSQRIVESHGGHLSLESEMGQGTTARVWLPA